MPGFSIGNKRVGDDAPVYFVAELSANHAQSRDKALKTIEAAARAGADAIKLQTYTADTLTLKSSATPFLVQTDNVWAGRTLHDLYAEAMTPWEWHRELIDAATALGLACFSTPFDATAVHFLAELGVPAWKVASFELQDLPLVECIARQGQPVILSTGMASPTDVEAAVNACRDAGNEDLALLRCVSAYPAEPGQMNLRTLELLRSFGTVVGLSDHTRDAVAAITAVSLGARIIEKHFIVDRAWGGPDAFFSVEPDEFKRLVAEVRTCEQSLGRARLGPTPSEEKSLPFRRSLFVARDVAAGEVLTCDDVRSVRPSNGLPPRALPQVLGRRAARALRAAEPLTWDMVGRARPQDSVELRPAAPADARALLMWRNDEQTRNSSRTTAPVSEAEHAAWLEATLASPNRKLYVAWAEGKPVGQLRLDLDRRSTPSAEVSLTVAPEARRRGLAVALLATAEPIARALGLKTLLAEVRVENEASVKAFKRAGYYGFARRPGPAGPMWTCERRIAGYAP